MQKIIGIYNANGTLLGEMRYLFEKIFFKKRCALCDITHGLSYKAKPAWLKQVERFPMPIETLHLDEISDDIRQVVADNVPCVVIVEGGLRLQGVHCLKAVGCVSRTSFLKV